MSKDVLFNEVVSKIVQAIFMGIEYDNGNGCIMRNPAPIEGIIGKIMSELDYDELKARVQKELEDKYMDEVVKTVVSKLKNNLYEKEQFGDKIKFSDFVSKGLESAIEKHLNESEEFKNTLNESINLDDVEIKVSIAKKERV